MSARLMIPGPVELEAAVLETLAQPAVPHYGAAWVALHNETISLLQQVFRTTGRTYMLPGSGTIAVDAAVHSAFLPGETVIVGNNGWFGERLLSVLSANGIHAVPIVIDPRQPLSADDFTAALQAHPEAAGVALVHLETSTGVLNPVQHIAEQVRSQRPDILLMIDAVTGLAGAELHTEAWGIDLCVSASQKALGAPAGLGLVVLSDRAWAKIDSRPDMPRSWYLDLKRWQWYVEHEADWHPFPVTMPTSIVLALRTALHSLLHQGLDSRLNHYRQMAAHLRTGLMQQGMKLFAHEDTMAATITAAYCPPGITAPEIRDYLLRECNVQITTGFGPYKQDVIRVGHMGGALDMQDVDHLLTGIAACLERTPS
jgi:alanine-glyoxylate transaminase / serine-glyoxylate transaminase / serine-pyruvate transaminase